MNEHPFTDDVDNQERIFKEPAYKDGWQAGLAMINDTTNLTNKIDELQMELNRKNLFIELLNNRIEKLQNELELTWYQKLLRKLPRISIVIKKGV